MGGNLVNFSMGIDPICSTHTSASPVRHFVCQSVHERNGLPPKRQKWYTHCSEVDKHVHPFVRVLRHPKRQTAEARATALHVLQWVYWRVTLFYKFLLCDAISFINKMQQKSQISTKINEIDGNPIT